MKGNLKGKHWGMCMWTDASYFKNGGKKFLRNVETLFYYIRHKSKRIP